jgi:two-component system chemotaxis response regulator CheB
MGRDGAQGMLELKEAGAYNIAQDEESCVVFGMPKEAIALGGAHEVQPLDAIASRLVQLAGLRTTAL